MKIGILTFHKGPNHGAYLQAMVTMRFFRALGHNAVLINYQNRTHWRKERILPWLKYRHPIRFLDHWKKQKAFKNDQRLFEATEFTTDPAEVKKLHFDLLVVGSDVVWDYTLFGHDDLFFGALNADRKIAYAASFGKVNYGTQIPAPVKKGLRRFDAISVRDENSRKIVESVLGERPVTVLDPCFLDDFSNDERHTKTIDRLERYLLVYAFAMRPEEIEMTKRFASERGLKTVALGYRQKWCDKNLMGVGPLEWLAFYRKAQYVVTSTFHGTIFAIKYRKQFLVSMNEKIKNRVVSLLHSAGLEERTFGDIELLEDEIDYRGVEKRLRPKIELSAEFLSQNLP